MSTQPKFDDETQAFLESLPELKEGEKFQFACHPGVACFNACCSDLNMPLTPYDVLRLRFELDMDSETFLSTYTTVSQYPHTGFPLFHLKMNDSPVKECPFVSPAGCTVYPNRSAACRTYPLGRATREDENGTPVEQYFIVQEEHCHGFSETKEWTSSEWLKDQGLEPYNQYNDRYMHLMARQLQTGRSLAEKHVTMCMLAFYQLDRFAGFIEGVNLFSRLNLSEEEQQRILSDEEARLDFAFNWIELVLFGDNNHLSIKE